jgi:hypothetical protein
LHTTTALHCVLSEKVDLAGEAVRAVLDRSPRGFRQQTSCFAKRARVLGVLLAAGYCILAALATGSANGDVGDLGPPPAESEIKQALIDFYSAGHPLGSTVDVRFDGPILVGQPTEHANPPPGPWCVRCGYPDQGVSPMYPVLALVTVTINQGLQSSALSPSNSVETRGTQNGTSCAGPTQSRYCPDYYLYRDGRGNWQVA